MLTQIQLYTFVKPLLKHEFNPNETMKLLSMYGTRLWCWGISQRVNIDNKSLCLKVSGLKHKGWVIITLDFDDTYIVNIMSNKGVILDTFEQVYFDSLFDIIDKRIEID